MALPAVQARTGSEASKVGPIVRCGEESDGCSEWLGLSPTAGSAGSLTPVRARNRRRSPSLPRDPRRLLRLHLGAFPSTIFDVSAGVVQR